MAIPGQQDHALQKFEDRLYLELCNQHDRVDLFVSSKADEIHRRLESLSDLIGRLIDKCDGDGSPRVSLKRQRRFSKYERDLLRCEEEILALSRFIKAQAEAFRKITKKYKVGFLATTHPPVVRHSC
jgi:SPX domain protein involved in polyphosphate accumulation